MDININSRNTEGRREIEISSPSVVSLGDLAADPYTIFDPDNTIEVISSLTGDEFIPIFVTTPTALYQVPFTVFQQRIIGIITPVAYSGDYNDLLNRPVIPHRTGELINDSGFLTDAISELARTGNWNDIIAKPTSFPPSPHSHSWVEIIGKPTFSAISASGSYTDLLNVPISFTPSPHTHIWGDITSKPAFAPITFTGLFEDILATPTTISGYGITDALNINGGILLGKLIAETSSALEAGLNLPPGVTPSIPLDGDIWTTTAGLFWRINGVTQQAALTSILSTVATSGLFADLLSKPTTILGYGITDQISYLDIAQSFSAKKTALASATGSAGFNFPHGVAPTAPVNGDLWTTTAGTFLRINGVTQQVAFTSILSTVAVSGLFGDLLSKPTTILGYGITDQISYLNITQTFTAKKTTLASATGGAGLNLPHGTAPTTPVDGDIWTTTGGGLFARINGVTQNYGASTVSRSGLFADLLSKPTTIAGYSITDQISYLNVAQSFSAKKTFAASATGGASINIPAGVAPTSPVDGDLWTTATALLARINGVSQTVAFTSILAPVSLSGDYNDLTNKPTSLFNGGTITVNITTSDTNPLYIANRTSGSLNGGLRIDNAGTPVGAIYWDYTNSRFIDLFGNRFWLGAGAPSTVAASGLFADILSKPTTTIGYGIGNAVVTDGTSTISGGDLYLVRSNVGGQVSMYLQNLDNTNTSSAARFNLVTGGASAGSPYIYMEIGSIQGWAIGIDNADADKFKINPGQVPSGGVFNIEVGGRVSVGLFNITHGSAPGTPVNGDIWTTSAGGLFARINGVTQNYGASTVSRTGLFADLLSKPTTLLGYGITDALNIAGGTLTGKLTTLASATGGAGFNLVQGAAPTSPVDGDIWSTTNGLFARINGVTQQVDLQSPIDSRSSAPATIGLGDRNKYIEYTGTLDLTQAFTAAATLGNGFVVHVRNLGTGIITLDPNGSETIDGSTTLKILPQQDFSVICNGTNFTTRNYRHVVLLQTTTISAGASNLIFTLPKGYKHFIVKGTGIINNTGTTALDNLAMRVSTDGGSSYFSTAVYQRSFSFVSGTSTLTSGSNSGETQTYILFDMAGSLIYGTAFEMFFYPSIDGTVAPNWFCNFNTFASGSSFVAGGKASGVVSINARVNAITLYPQANNFGGGIVTLEGVV
jgi:hypothetical protein